MGIIDTFISGYIAMLRNVGIIKNPLRWSRFLLALALLHYFLAFLHLLLLLNGSPETWLTQLLSTTVFVVFGFIWHRMSRRLRSI